MNFDVNEFSKVAKENLKKVIATVLAAGTLLSTAATTALAKETTNEVNDISMMDTINTTADETATLLADDYIITTAQEYYEEKLKCMEGTSHGWIGQKINLDKIRADAKNYAVQFPSDVSRKLMNVLLNKDINNTKYTYADIVDGGGIFLTDELCAKVGVTTSEAKMQLIKDLANIKYGLVEINIENVTGIDLESLITTSKNNINYIVVDEDRLVNYKYLLGVRLGDYHIGTLGADGSYMSIKNFDILNKTMLLKRVREAYNSIENEDGKLMLAVLAAQDLESCNNAEIVWREDTYSESEYLGMSEEEARIARAELENARGENTKYVLNFLGYEAELTSDGSKIRYKYNGQYCEVNLDNLINGFYIPGKSTTEVDKIYINYVVKGLHIIEDISKYDNAVQYNYDRSVIEFNTTIEQLDARVAEFVAEASYGMAGTQTTTEKKPGMFTDTFLGTVLNDALVKLAPKNIFKGYPDGSFQPNKDLTRAEAAASFDRATGATEAIIAAAPTPTFPDLVEWQIQYVGYAQANKIVNGYPDGTFKPNNPVKDEEAIKMGLVLEGVYEEAIEKMKAGESFADAVFEVAEENNLTENTGMTKGSNATRGELAIFMQNVLE